LYYESLAPFYLGQERKFEWEKRPYFWGSIEKRKREFPYYDINEIMKEIHESLGKKRRR
jgi:hypothetical protein